jgi:hypothetical protein
MATKLRIDVEISVEDDKKYLNFWDYINGNDVTAELVQNKLYQDDKEITLQQFVDKVVEEVNKW